MLVGLLGVHAWYIRKQESPNANILKGFMVGAAVWALVCLIMASIVSGGLAKTCSEFEKNDQHSSCGAIFGYGFFEGQFVGKGKSINTISAATTSGWMVMLGWMGIAVYEYFLYRNANNLWWTSI